MNAIWTLAQRAHKMNPSVIREILKVTERPGIISFAGGLPSARTFPKAEFAAACATVLANDGDAALQYGASEGYAPLRQAVADMLPWDVNPNQVLITTGSQQGLDLIAKVLIDAGSRVLVETPTYLGALQAFTPMEPDVHGVASDDEGVDIADLSAQAAGARFLYVLPNFQNPTGRTMSEARRAALSAKAQELGLPIVEDNPYGDLWFDQPPPLPLQAKQAADLHTPSFNQRMVSQVMQGDFLARHVPTIRARYKAQRDAMLSALAREMQGLDVSWNQPQGGMFLWARLPQGLDATAFLDQAVAHGVAYVPGLPFFAEGGDPRSLRLSFVTPSVDEINAGVAQLATAIRQALA